MKEPQRDNPVKVVEQGSRGALAAVEWGKPPFEIKRFYAIYGVRDADAVRGEHAHKETDQVLFVVRGSLTLHFDDGKEKGSLVMTPSEKGARLPPKLWHSMDSFSQDCIAIVVASRPYDESDYIREYDAFKRYVGTVQ